MDELRLDPSGPVLVTGGYGTVGAEIARMVAVDAPVLLTGRSPERGRALADAVGGEVRAWDLADPAAFRADVRAVISSVNDPDDRVLRAAVSAGVPYVDITRWTSRLQRAVALAALLRPDSPVLFSSAWMGGVSSLVAAALAADLGGAERVEIAVRWDTADRAGADSVEFMDRLGVDFEVVDDGARRLASPLTEARTVGIGGTPVRVARIDTPEQFTLPLTLGTTTAATRIGFSSPGTTRALLALRGTGFFRWAAGERWTPLRRALLHSPGEGGTARLRVDVSHAGRVRTATVTDPRGQHHLTAVGAVLGLRRVLGTDGSPAPRGPVFPEQHPAPARAVEALAALGVDLDLVLDREADRDADRDADGGTGGGTGGGTDRTQGGAAA
ncbi:saccharopine dehydrogenase family protein [Streptomyces tirandamycinicus]|uniref:saccharopine dehydrogenase n=1 Tax=Streptomyces tirandamycinicus TaxID=2174846 RepID=UPI00226D68B9|nr:saccharopine dehydrogenase [Streptomyces tirandamycinicus]MCY0985389.1 saccharopine dehydrogenase [Streptomyces tirandamycinicus]